MTKKKKADEKRKHSRVPAIHNLAKPIEIIFDKPKTVSSAPAVLVDLSPGGMGLLTFIPINKGTIVTAQIDFKGLKTSRFCLKSLI